LRHLRPHPRGDQASGTAAAPGGLTMAGNRLSRRLLLQAGAGLMLSLELPLARAGARAGAPSRFTPNAFISIGEDGQVALTMPYVEMGQGTYTAISMLLAEDLEVALENVRLIHAPPDEEQYGNPLLAGVQ